ncbi:ladderlectin [Clarias gariepinus]|uniref:ladderlectin n=1 Tax=Clarias gariepinus TaxID=13013 RepID=UPI00234DECB1|nr:ladderlectin [Clarias gariepinus]
MKYLVVFVLVSLAFTAYATSPGNKCSSGWSGFGKKCYKYIAESKPWVQAELYCQVLGGNLASVHSNQTHSFLKRMTRLSGSFTRTWLGAQNAIWDTVWFWSDGSVFDFTKWHSGEPNNPEGYERCLEMNYGDEVLWNNLHCNTELYFMCQKSAF